jgi:hypothetical protein
MQNRRFYMTMKLALLLSLAVTTGGLAVGCSDRIDATATVEQGLVTQAVSGAAAETVVSSLASGKLVMTYNENDPSKITFNNDGRQVARGASMMGFAQVGLFDGTKITGRVRPPSEWAVLWGDPSITRSRANPQNVYIANIAVPANKFPGIINGPIDAAPASVCGSYLGGACVARSSDGGRNFTLTNNDCFRRTTDCALGAYYDGSSIETSPEGRIYAAFVDVQRNRIDVWMAGGHNSPFSRITDPPTPVSGAAHPRLKFGPGGLYLLYQSGNSLLISRYSGGSSFTGSWTPYTTVATVGSFSGTVSFGANKGVRLGPDYDLDIGLTEGGTTAGARIIHTDATSTGKLFVSLSSCFTDPNQAITCGDRGSGWTTATLTGDQFKPAIAVTADSNVWWISFLNTNGVPNRTVELWSAQVSVGFQGVGSMRLRREVAAQTPCPDLRGYWGDYDSMAIGPGRAAYRGFTDSTITSCERFTYHAQPVRASLASWTASF